MDHLIEQIKAERDSLQAKVDALNQALAVLNGHEPTKGPSNATPKRPAVPKKKASASTGTFRQPSGLRWDAIKIIRQQRTITSNKLVEALKPKFPNAHKDSVNASIGYEPRYPFDVDKRRTEPWLWTWNQDKCDRNCAHWDWPPLDGHCVRCTHPKGAHDGSGKCVRSGCGCMAYGGVGPP